MLKFTVRTEDYECFTVYDYTEYILPPNNPIVEVDFPDSQNTFYTFFTPNECTMLTTKNLGFCSTVTTFPDGVYKFRFSVAPNATLFEEVYVLNSLNLKLDIANYFKDNKTMSTEKLCFIDANLEAAKSIVSSDPDTAKLLYNEAANLFKKLTCDV